VIACVVLLAGCGGGGSATPTTPTSPTTPTTAAAPLTVAVVAPTLGSEINSVFIAAMRSGASALAQDRARDTWYLALVEPLLGVPLFAQGGFVATCSAGGNIRIQTLGAAAGGGRVTLANTPVTFSTCTSSVNGRSVIANGTLNANGNWTASEPSSPVRLSGELTVNEIGIVAIDGTTGSSFVGAVGGISVGVADTPPPPNPAPPVCPTPVPTPQCPAPSPTPTPMPTPTPTALNVTGTWRTAGSTEALVLTQTGTAISGTVTIGSTPVTIVTNSITGSVAGNNVTFTWTLVGQAPADTATIRSSSVTVFTMVASSSSAMSGSVVATITTSCAGSQFCPPDTVTKNPSTASFTKQ